MAQIGPSNRNLFIKKSVAKMKEKPMDGDEDMGQSKKRKNLMQNFRKFTKMK